MTGRSLPEWVGKTPDAKIPTNVRVRVFERFGGVCQLTGWKITPADDWDVDHERPLALGGEHRESNLRPVLREAHRAKSKQEVRLKAKADRIRKRHLGIKTKKPGGFRGWRKMNGELVWKDRA